MWSLIPICTASFSYHTPPGTYISITYARDQQTPWYSILIIDRYIQDTPLKVWFGTKTSLPRPARMGCFSVLSAILVTISLLSTGRADSPQIVDLGYAIYQGTFNSTANTTNFLRVRYAAPPVGKHAYYRSSPTLDSINVSFRKPTLPSSSSTAWHASTGCATCEHSASGVSSSGRRRPRYIALQRIIDKKSQAKYWDRGLSFPKVCIRFSSWVFSY